MLLRYLQQARHADNHSIQEIVEQRPGRYEFSVPGGPGGVYIHSLKTGADGRVVEYSGSRPPVIVDEPPQINVVAVKNSGQWFQPPTSHLGRPINLKHPVAIAELGLRFYGEFFRETERRFFEKSKR